MKTHYFKLSNGHTFSTNWEDIKRAKYEEGYKHGKNFPRGYSWFDFCMETKAIEITEKEYFCE